MQMAGFIQITHLKHHQCPVRDIILAIEMVKGVADDDERLFEGKTAWLVWQWMLGQAAAGLTAHATLVLRAS